MPSVGKCTNCGRSNLEPGSLISFGKVYFRPEMLKFLTIKQSVRVSASVCLDCGNVQLFASPHEVEQITQRAQADRRQGFPVAAKTPPDERKA